jgi:GxxExxY protein
LPLSLILQLYDMSKLVKDFLYEKESYEVRGACFDVWKEFRGMFKESIVDNALTIALEKRGLVVESQKRINIFYEGKKVGTYVPDKVVNNIIIIELKSRLFITKQDEATFWNYLKGSEYKLGFLINFSPTKLIIKRVVYDTARQA